MTTRTTKRSTDVFKPAKKGDRLCAAYLYSDGHLEASFERYIRDVDKRVTYYKQIDSMGLLCRFKGRIVFSRYSGVAWLRAMLAAGATEFSAQEPTFEGGSESTKRRGIPVGYVTAVTPLGDVIEYDMPGLISFGHTYQPDAEVSFSDDGERIDHALVETLRLDASVTGSAKVLR